MTMGNHPSVMGHSFTQVNGDPIPRSRFDRPSTHKTTFDADWLVPIYLDETLPGDVFNMTSHVFARLTTPEFPLMDNLYLDLFWFWVPYRTLWDDWERFLGAQDNPTDSIDFTIPPVSGSSSEDLTAEPITDYFRLPQITNAVGTEISGLPFRAYNSIWNHWFRHQDLQDSATVITSGSAGAGLSLYPLRKRCKKHDYFTSALPWPQKGDAVSLPLGTTAPVLGLGLLDTSSANAGPTANLTTTKETPVTFGAHWRTNSSDLFIESDVSGTSGEPQIFADLENATAATINDLRLAYATQRFLEIDARGGTRIREHLMAHFGTDTGDARVQDPEYLGGSSHRINVTPVANTSGIGTQGQLAAFGTASGQAGFTKSFVE